jgi:VCBS repeat-containing protein
MNEKDVEAAALRSEADRTETYSVKGQDGRYHERRRAVHGERTRAILYAAATEIQRGES